MKKLFNFIVVVCLITLPIIAFASNYFVGEVVEIVSDVPGDGINPPSQDIVVRIGNDEIKANNSGGPFLGERFDKVKIGDEIILIEDNGNFYVKDKYRIKGIYWVMGIFVLFVVMIGRIKGLMSFIGLIITMFVLGFFIVPFILKGYSPILISIIGSFLIIFSSIYISHGFTRRTSVAVLGTIFSLICAILLSYIFVEITKLSGFGSEEAHFLQFDAVNINMKGILFAGIIIGVLGVLDDITTSQAAIVDELYKANPLLSGKEIYKRALSIGRDHIASLVNTLVLAYSGASFPLFIMFYINKEEPYWSIFNSEFMVEEIVRTFTGSIVLVISVPITTLIGIYFLCSPRNKDTLYKPHPCAFHKHE